jgi:DNA-binding XRE family transcriptional regulator
MISAEVGLQNDGVRHNNLGTNMTHEAKPQDKSAISDRFIALRMRWGLSQSRLGRVVGLCRQTVSEIENRHVTPHDATWDRFCEHEGRTQEPGIGHLPEHYWRDCLINDEAATKGDTICASR